MAELPRVNAADDLPLGRGRKVYVEGYEVQVATVLAPGFDTETQSAHVYGANNPLTSTIVNGSSLTMELLERSNNNKVLQVLSGLRPEALVLKEYKFQEFEETSVWANLKHPKEDRYVRAEFWRRWRPGPGDPSIPPNEWGRNTLSGQSDLAARFDEAVGVGVRIESEKLQVSSSGAGAGYTVEVSRDLVHLPSSGVNIVRLLVLNGTAAGAVTAKDEIDVTVKHGAGGQRTVFVEDVELLATRGAVTHMFVQYLMTGTGTVKTDTTQKTDELYKAN